MEGLEKQSFLYWVGGIDTLVSAEGHHLHFLEVKLSYQK